LPRLRSPGIRASVAWKLFLASFLSLFVELALIRWIPGTVHIVGFFANLILIASFLGLGIGMVRSAPAEASIWRFLLRLAVVVTSLGVVHVVNPEVSLPASGDYGLNEAVLKVGLSIPLPIVLVAIFLLAAWVAVPLGQLVAGYLDGLERIRAYSINIGGSLAGVAMFSLLAWGSLPPEVWFGFAIGLALLLHRKLIYVTPVAIVAGMLFLLHLDDSDRFSKDVRWSPYYKVVTTPVSTSGRLSDGFVTDVNGQFLLSGLDLRPEASLVGESLPSVAQYVDELKSYYALPFQMRPPGRVLVLGAGAGNDVAAALRNGATHVTAVEIDPLVLQLGQRYHPEEPFRSPRVTPVVDDARAFLNGSHERFDLIIYATLDAHGLLSGAANVRLDSFAYTEESLRSARDHLSENGVVVLSFGPFREDIQLRQYSMVRSVFGRDPIYLLHRNGHRTLIAGSTEGLALDTLPTGWSRITDAEIEDDLARYPYAALSATDDWPHLYIRNKSVPIEYLGVLIGILLVSLVLIWRSYRGVSRLDGQFFFLGAGFLLMETKSVTQFALLVGSTWQTNSLVFTVILAMILAANIYVARRLRLPPVQYLYGLLIAVLVASYAWPISRWQLAPGLGSYLAAAIYLGIPILLAAIIFAVAFRKARLGSEALASNLLGAIVGGTLEYLSLALGMRALSLLAAAMYLAAFVFWLKTRSASESASDRIEVARSVTVPSAS
jgi:spermidine synthase